MVDDLAGEIQRLALLLPGFLLAITVHEAAHGYAAYRMGDPTAKLAGRLTLNPLKHIDPIGLLVLVVTRFIGWAKPVPIDTRYFKNPRRGMALSSLAGPGANLLLAVVLTLMFGLTPDVSLESARGFQFWDPMRQILENAVVINVVLACFNLLPIPPLDGSHVLSWLLPWEAARRFESWSRWGFALIILLAMTGILSQILNPVAQVIFNLLNAILRAFL